MTASALRAVVLLLCAESIVCSAWWALGASPVFVSLAVVSLVTAVLVGVAALIVGDDDD